VTNDVVGSHRPYLGCPAKTDYLTKTPSQDASGILFIYLQPSPAQPTFSNNTHLDTSRCILYNMAGDTLAQASVIRFRSSWNVGRGVAYTRCLVYPHRRKCNGFRSGERGGHSTQPPYPMTYCRNVPRMYCWALDTLCGGAPSC
ncbi:hypothetical protein AVEN_30481-1, partial [Araneus ventricosus]